MASLMKAHEKSFSIFSHKGHASERDKEIPLHTYRVAKTKILIISSAEEGTEQLYPFVATFRES